MLDMNRIRKDPGVIRQALLKRMDAVDFADLLQWDQNRRALIARIGGLRERRNRVSSQNSPDEEGGPGHVRNPE